ncbi:MAG: Anaerobic regulatory protein [Bacteroidetes bacterium ADurb.Bin141]|nr:MAG: Anaerobic regulatory protein [Bacteroidetes bacterium ADurb.Bin141]
MHTFLKDFFSKEWREFILFHSKVVKFKKNEVIFSIGHETQGIYFIIDGKVKVTTGTGTGTERIIGLATNNDIIGHRGFGGIWKYTVSATTLENSELLFIPLKIFNIVFKANPEFAYFMMMFFANELRDSEKLASQLPIRNVIASVLYNNVKVFGYEKGSKKMRYTPSRKDMASQAGTRYETLVRTLADFNAEGIIRIDGKSIHILKEAALLKMRNGEE